MSVEEQRRSLKADKVAEDSPSRSRFSPKRAIKLEVQESKCKAKCVDEEAKSPKLIKLEANASSFRSEPRHSTLTSGREELTPTLSKNAKASLSNTSQHELNSKEVSSESKQHWYHEQATLDHRGKMPTSNRSLCPWSEDGPSEVCNTSVCSSLSDSERESAVGPNELDETVGLLEPKVKRAPQEDNEDDVDRRKGTSGPSCSSVDAFEFNITVEPSAKRIACDYVFNEEKNCLYAKPFVYVPFVVHCSQNPPPHAFIRVCAFYAQGAHASQPVKRCPHHLAADKGELHEHFVVAESIYASYINAAEEGQRSHVTVPFPCSPDPPFVPLQFMCYSSCNGGISRRSLLLCFTLETNNEKLGHRQMSLKVCANPSRDAGSDETELTRKRRRPTMVSYAPETPTASNDLSQSPVTEDDDTIYEIQIRGSRLYKLVSTIVSHYELSRRYLREGGRGEANAHVASACAGARPLSQRASVASWLAGLHLSKYESAFSSKSLYIIADLEGVINKKFLASLGVTESDAAVLLKSYLSWFDVYNAQRQNALSSAEESSTLL